jgi:predicted nucleotide-binding protein
MADSSPVIEDEVAATASQKKILEHGLGQITPSTNQRTTSPGYSQHLDCQGQSENAALEELEQTPQQLGAADFPSAKAATKPKRKNHIIFVGSPLWYSRCQEKLQDSQEGRCLKLPHIIKYYWG